MRKIQFLHCGSENKQTARTIDNLISELGSHFNFDSEIITDVIIVPSDRYCEVLNNTTRANGVEGGYFNESPTGSALPIDATQKVIIFLSLETVVDFFENNKSGASVTIIEEVLHAKLYDLTWKRGKSMEPPLEYGGAVRQIWPLAASVYQEYVVNRWVYEVASPIDLEVPRVSNRVDAALAQIGSLALQVRTELIGFKSAWQTTVNLLHREVFIPLATNATYIDEVPDNGSSVWGEDFPVTSVQSYWEEIHALLSKDFSSSTFDFAGTVYSISLILLAFCESQGVRVEDLGDGACHVNFLQI